MNSNDINAVNEIRALALDMIRQKNGGNSGLSLSVAPILYTLYTRHLMYNPKNPDWMNRDRFVLSASYAAPVFYAVLHLCGFNISREDLMKFGHISFKCPSFPEYGLTPGAEVTTSPFGDGISYAVGFALGERYIRNLLKAEEDENLIDFRTYVLCDEAELMNGEVYESTSFAGVQHLEKLMILCNVSKVTADGYTKEVSIEDIEKRFNNIGFYTDIVPNGENLKNIDKAILNAKKSKKPSIIFFNTVFAHYSKYENQNTLYNKAIDNDDYMEIKKKLDIPLQPFDIRKDTIIHVNKIVEERVNNKYQESIEIFDRLKKVANNKIFEILKMLLYKNVTIPFESLIYKPQDTYMENMAVSNHQVLNLVASKSDLFLGGTANKNNLTNIYLDNTEKHSPEKVLGKNIYFGLREQAMGGIINGLALLGLRVYCGTILSESDVLKKAMRASTLMNLPVTYIFTHDSVASTDTSTILEPVEQLVALRSIPNMFVFRPCDINEILGSWEFISKSNKTVSLVLSDQKIAKISSSDSKLVEKGAYVIAKEEKKIDGILIATGAEVTIALKIKERLKEENIDIRVVSMPCQELFLKESKEYQQEILSENKKIICLEPSSRLNWGLFVTDEKYILGLDEYGFSGTSEEVLKELEYNFESLILKVMRLLLSES